MSICRGIFTEICSPIFLPIFRDAGSETEVILDPIELPDGAVFNPVARTIREGRTVTIQYEPYLEGLGDADFPDFSEWSQLNLASAMTTLQYLTETTTDSREDIINTDLNSGFGGSRVWMGEVDAQSDIPANAQGVWFIRDTADTDDGGSIAWGFGSNLGTGTSLTSTFSTGAWRGAHTLSSLQTYFESNTYNANTRYYYYDTVLREVRRFVRTTAEIWTEFEMDDAIDEVEFNELTINTSELLSRGILRATLADDAIPADVLSKFRVDIELNQN